MSILQSKRSKLVADSKSARNVFSEQIEHLGTINDGLSGCVDDINTKIAKLEIERDEANAEISANKEVMAKLSELV